MPRIPGTQRLSFEIRGHRIQAEEIEQALLTMAEISQAAVAVHKDVHGDDRLVAYVTPAGKKIPPSATCAIG